MTDHAIEMRAALLRSQKREAARRGHVHLERVLDEGGPCGATFDGNDYCTRPDGHKGPHNIRPPEPPEAA